MASDQNLASRARALEPVEIRKVVDMIEGEDAIPLAAGWPNADSFPIDELAELTSTAFRDRGADLLQYGLTQGQEELRTRIAERLRSKHGIDVVADELLVTSGSQQGLYLTARALLEDGDTAVVGAPTYVAALTAFESLTRPTYRTIQLDDKGLDVEQLEAELEECSPSLVYVVPTFQNPTGLTMSKGRRKRLVELAHEHDFIIVEDTPYAELGYESSPPAPIASIDRDQTIYLGSFSKILSPGLRLGWVLAPAELTHTFKLLKQPVDLHTSTLSQYVAADYLRSGVVDDQIRRIRSLYSDKYALALETLRDTMPEYVDWTRPDGGMFLWMTLPERYDTERLLETAIDNGVAFIPGHAFYATDPKRNTLRINYTYTDDSRLVEGITILADTIREYEPGKE